MKVIFLDIDGVLNIMSPTYNSFRFTQDPIEEHLMVRLEFILERVPDAKIVISSSWGYDKAVNKLKQHHFKYIDKVIGEIKRNHEYRGMQINDWLRATDEDIASIVVLEDEIIDVCGTICDVVNKNCVVEVNMNEGLSNANAICAVQKLMSIGYLIDKTITPFVEDLIKYNFYIERGYRPSVLINTPPSNDDLKRWDYFLNDNSSLTLIMKKG